MTRMTISARGVLEIAEHEGIVLGPYKDSRGVWTYGIGHTAGAGDPVPANMLRVDTRLWTAEQVRREVLRALRVFDKDLDRFEARVNDVIKVPLAQHQFDALVSFDFNTGGVHRAQLTRAINAGDMSGDGFMGWTKPPEVIGRRKAEQALFRTGDYGANGDRIALFDAHGDGQLSRRGSISGTELADLMRDAGAMRSPPRPEPKPVPLTLEPARKEGAIVESGTGIRVLVAGAIVAVGAWLLGLLDTITSVIGD